MNWRHLEPPDPMDIYKRRTPVGRPDPIYKAIALCREAATRCETCGVPMTPEEVAYSGPRWCCDCHSDRIERERSK